MGVDARGRGNAGAAGEAYAGSRPQLLGIAYRMLGSFSEAEDVLHDAFARLLQVPEPDDPQRWLAVVVSRLCIDRLRASRRHATYVGAWLPEPVADGSGVADPVDRVTLDDTISMALLVVLEQLSPAERAAFVLHDVFGMPFEELGRVVGRTPVACRQLASRARRKIRADGRQRFTVDQAQHRLAVERFATACASGDVEALAEALDPDVVLVTDGGGAVRAGSHPVPGRRRVSKLLRKGFELYPGVQLVLSEINGQPGLLALHDGGLVGAFAFSIEDGRISQVLVVANPDKLHALGAALSVPIGLVQHRRDRAARHEER